MAKLRVRVERSWKFFAAILIPLILLPIYFVTYTPKLPPPPPTNSTFTEDDLNNSVLAEEDDPMKEIIALHRRKFRLAYIILVMAVFWLLEIIPLPITSLFPLVLFPLFGVDNATSVSQSYMKESNTIFLGGAIVALAVEYCNLHRRVALRLINIVGVSPRRLMFGIMVVVSFLSMWISNTTCTTMVIPIIVAVVDEIHDVTDATIVDTEIHFTTNNNDDSTIGQDGSPALSQQRRSLDNHRSSPHFERLSMRRHSDTFSNAALSSHENHRHSSNDSTPDEEQPRGALGMLVGHRSEEPPNRSPMLQVRHLNEHQRSPRGSLSSSKSHVIPEININDKPPSKPLPLQLLQIRDELTAEDHAGSLGGARNSIGSITEPGRIETMINLPSPSATCEEAERKKKKVEREKWRRIKNMYLFALCYAANIGGTATITGTGPNKVFKEVIKPHKYIISQDGKFLGMTFFTWMAFNIPPMLVNNVVAWSYLTLKYCGLPKFSKMTPEEEANDAIRKWKEQTVRSYLRTEYKKLGKMTFHEIGVAIVFLLVVFLWIFRDPDLFTGWDATVSKGQTGDSTAALLGAVLLFIIPKNWAFLSKKDGAHFEALLDWKVVSSKLPWGVLLLLGSGYAIGDSAERTGLTEWVGEELSLLHDLPAPVLLAIVMIITAFITEVCSNTACAAIILPVLIGISEEMGIHPLYLSVAATVSASYAFMLPVASPVNAIVFAAGDFSIWEMITNGYILNGICVFVFYINTLTLGEWMFNYNEFTYPPPEPPPEPPALLA